MLFNFRFTMLNYVGYRCASMQKGMSDSGGSASELARSNQSGKSSWMKVSHGERLWMHEGAVSRWGLDLGYGGGKGTAMKANSDVSI